MCGGVCGNVYWHGSRDPRVCLGEHAYIHVYTDADERTYANMYAHSHAHVYMLVLPLVYALVHTHVHAHGCTHGYTHVYTQVRVHNAPKPDFRPAAESAVAHS